MSFWFWPEGYEDDSDAWADIWINSFAKYGVKLPPPPPQVEWYNNGVALPSNDPALLAVLKEDIDAVREHFQEPRDLLRWRQNEFTCGYVVGFSLGESVLHLAFATLNLDVLRHLFAVSPLAFTQLMGMTNTEEHMGEGAALPLLYSISLAYRSEVTGEPLHGAEPTAAARQAREERLPAVMTWLCETGLMTPVLAEFCFPGGPASAHSQVSQTTSTRCIITAKQARRNIPNTALAVLQRWEQLSMKQQRMLTLSSLADVMCIPVVLCALPWAHERILWIGRQDENSLLDQLSPGVLKLVVRAAGDPCWVQHAASEVIADLRGDLRGLTA